MSTVSARNQMQHKLHSLKKNNKMFIIIKS